MNWINKPMIEQTWQEELLGCLIIFAVIVLILLFGELTYKFEERRRQMVDKNKRKEKAKKNRIFIPMNTGEKIYKTKKYPERNENKKELKKIIEETVKDYSNDYANNNKLKKGENYENYS